MGTDRLLQVELSYPEPGTARLWAAGEVDLSNTDRMRELLHCRLRSELNVVVVDISELSFLSISGARMLAEAAQQAMEHSTELRILIGGSRSVHRVLRACGIEDNLPIHHPDAP